MCSLARPDINMSGKTSILRTNLALQEFMETNQSVCEIKVLLIL